MVNHYKLTFNDKAILRNRLACAFVAALVTMGVSVHAQRVPPRPSLVVGIVVDGLNDEYLQLLKGYFGEGGFRRLMDEGVVLSDVDYGEGIDATAATAIVMSGTGPAVNGVPSTYVYNPETRLTHSIFTNVETSNEAYTPASLLVSTIADEIRIDAAGVSGVYSIAPDPERAVAMAAHAGNSALWINDIDGKWTTSTYYKDRPQPAALRNHLRPLAKELDTLSWVPSLNLQEYPDLPDYKRLFPFRHTFSKKDKNRYRAFKVSPYANTAVTDLADEYISSLQLGQRGVTDMLNLGYSLVPYPYTKETDNRTEAMDAYLRLDRDLARLFKTLDTMPGRDRVVVFLTGTPVSTGSKRDDEQWNIPHGEFSARKAIALLNMYLIALHGNGDWVTGYHNHHFYLNHNLIKSSDLRLSDIRNEAAEFLARMSGVSHVYTIDEIATGRAGNRDVALQRNTSLKHAGDLVITINPGWSTTDEDFDTDSKVTRAVYMSAPAFILAPGIAPKRIDSRVDARSIAPTVTRLVRIRAPNGASFPPLRLKD